MIEEAEHAQQLKEWHENFLRLFRKEFSKLSKEGKDYVSNMDDFHSPCQIEVFWLKQPEWQLIVKTHFKDRPDGEITINGPYDSSVFQDEVKVILNQPRWNVPIDENSPEATKYSHHLAEELHRFVEIAKNALFSDWKKLNGISNSFVGKNKTITHFWGNMANHDYHLWIQRIIDRANQQIEDSKKHHPPKEALRKINYLEGFATYFFPPIIIGGKSKRTISEIMNGVKTTQIPSFDKKIFDVIIDDVLVIVEKDGFVSTCTKDKTKSLEILNTLMMVSILDDLEEHVVREHELCQIKYSSETNDIVSYTHHNGPIRNQLFDGIPDKISGYETKYVEEERIRKIFEKTSTIFEDKDLSEDLRILLEATTHMKESEFSQAFIMSWKIIEKYLSKQWHQKYGNSNQRKSPKADVMITELKDMLKENFDIFTKFRKIRNKFLHDKKQITKNESEKCVNISKELILKNLDSQK